MGNGDRMLCADGGNPLLRSSGEWQAISLSSSSVFADMAALGDECGAVEPFNIVPEEQMKTGFVSQCGHRRLQFKMCSTNFSF